MQTIVDPQEQDVALVHWRGAHARIWRYHASLSRLALLLHRPHQAESMFIVAVGCVHVCGPVSWENVDLAQTQLVVDDAPDRAETRLSDPAAGFEARCSSLTLAYTTDLDRDEPGLQWLVGTD